MEKETFPLFNDSLPPWGNSLSAPKNVSVFYYRLQVIEWPLLAESGHQSAARSETAFKIIGWRLFQLISSNYQSETNK